MFDCGVQVKIVLILYQWLQGLYSTHSSNVGRRSISFFDEVPSTVSSSSWAFFCASGYSIITIRNALIVMTVVVTLAPKRAFKAGLITSGFAPDDKRLLTSDGDGLP